MKKDTKAWAIKLRGRSFYQDSYNIPYLYPTRLDAVEDAIDMFKHLGSISFTADEVASQLQKLK